MFNKKLGGGAILDVGCYPLSFISLFSNKESKIEFKTINGEMCHTNVDIDASAELLINNKIKCKVQVSLKKYFKNNSIIKGSKGTIIVNFPWLPEKKVFLEVVTKYRYYKTFINSEVSVYANQIKNVSNAFIKNNNGEFKLFDICASVNNMKNIDYWIKHIRNANKSN